MPQAQMVQNAHRCIGEAAQIFIELLAAFKSDNLFSTTVAPQQWSSTGRTPQCIFRKLRPQQDVDALVAEWKRE